MPTIIIHPFTSNLPSFLLILVLTNIKLLHLSPSPLQQPQLQQLLPLLPPTVVAVAVEAPTAVAAAVEVASVEAAGPVVEATATAPLPSAPKPGMKLGLKTNTTQARAKLVKHLQNALTSINTLDLIIPII